MSWVSWAACSLAFSRRAAMLDARRSAAALAGSPSPAEPTAPSAAGAGCRSSAAALEALPRGATVEKSLQGKQKQRGRRHPTAAAAGRSRAGGAVGAPLAGARRTEAAGAAPQPPRPGRGGTCRRRG